jgi:adenylosuccinate synthase
LQWGDEAKGKIVDLLTEHHDLVVRYQGGNNAGHTVVLNGQVFKFSLLPTGILRENVISVVAGGVVVYPPALLDEVKRLEGQGVRVDDKLRVSDRAHLIFPYHLAEEKLFEQRSNGTAIGTTIRGIGPCYRDKASRVHGVRVGDLFFPESFRERLSGIVHDKNRMIAALADDFTAFDADRIADEYLGYAEALRPYVTNTTELLHAALDSGKRILFEGAQGSLLDVDHGTYPFVTSSNSSACGVHSGSGVSSRLIDRTIGVVKAYTTRVGAGPFPTELDDEIGQRIRNVGKEYGTVTGRPRRCGWFDAVAARHGARLGAVDALAVMLLDVLSGLEEIKICVAYRLDGETIDFFPSHVEHLKHCEPVYRTLPGWKDDISGARRLEDLPAEARAVLDALAELLRAPVEIVSVGPDRQQTIYVKR